MKELLSFFVMIDFICNVLIAWLVILGIYNAFQEGNILFKLRALTEYRTHWMLRKVLYGCFPCMASVYGTAFWFLTGNEFSILWIVFIAALSGFNLLTSETILYNYFDEDSGI